MLLCGIVKGGARQPKRACGVGWRIKKSRKKYVEWFDTEKKDGFMWNSEVKNKTTKNNMWSEVENGETVNNVERWKRNGVE